MKTIKIKTTHPTDTPRYATAQSSGVDLKTIMPFTIYPSDILTINTGVYLQIPPGLEGQVRPRSGLAARHGITVLNTPGTIDADYRGEIKVILINLGAGAVSFTTGDRIAQLVFVPVEQVEFEHTPHLNTTTRGEGGLGSTDKK